MTLTDDLATRVDFFEHDLDTLNPYENDEGAPIVTDKHWPVLAPAAMHGTAGQIVTAFAPTTEADPAGILVTILAAFGAFVGTTDDVGQVKGSAFLRIANSRHATVIWPMLCGTTSSGAKGTAQGVTDSIVRDAISKLGLAPAPARRSGLSSGEGLIEAVRDDVGDPDDEKNFKPGVTDKRLLIVESEFAAVLRRVNREGSTTGPVLRQAWDGGLLSVMNRQAMTSTDPHIVIIGHISPGELKAVIRSNDVDGGTLNRFLFIATRRSKRLPNGGNAPAELIDKAGTLFLQAVQHAQHRGEVTMSEEARARWESIYYRLTAERPDTVLTKVTGRRAPQVLRLAMLYALIDNRGQITPDDLAAAEALEQYSVDTARYIFEADDDKDGSEIARLAEYIREAGAKGRARNEIREDFYKRHVDAKTITNRLKRLLEAGAIQEREVPTDGRKRTEYYAR